MWRVHGPRLLGRVLLVKKVNGGCGGSYISRHQMAGKGSKGRSRGSGRQGLLECMTTHALPTHVPVPTPLRLARPCTHKDQAMDQFQECNQPVQEGN